MQGMLLKGLCLLLSLLIQQDRSTIPPPIHFDVVSIKQNRSGAEAGGVEIPPEGDRIIVTNARMTRILAFAFNRNKNDRIEGLPDWASDQRWDIQAKIAEEDIPAFHRLSFEQQKLLLQLVLQDRCQMKAHMERKEVPVYALVAAKGGPKLHQASSPEGNSVPIWNIHTKPGEIEAHAVPITALIYALTSLSLDRQILDKTALTALYDLHLKWTPNDTPSSEDTEQSPPLFTAMEDQLGLRLQPTKAQVDALIVERIDRPTPN